MLINDPGVSGVTVRVSCGRRVVRSIQQTQVSSVTLVGAGDLTVIPQ